MTELYNKIYRAKAELDNAVHTGNGIASKRTALSNILFNNVDEIMKVMTAEHDFETEREALKREITQYEGDIAALNDALAEADKEIAKLRSTKKKAE